MDVKFPVSSYRKLFDYRCFMAAGHSPAVGVQLKAEFVKPGRPQVIKTILLVDDDPNYLKSAQQLLRDYNVKVVAVDPGLPIREQGLKLVAEHNPELVVMDGQMFNTSGPELVKELRDLKYKGYIAANSASGKKNKEMMGVGADFVIPGKGFFNFLGYLKA
ncbi:MAG: response regulator [Candidatus Margulisiibacteriota bacterium]